MAGRDYTKLVELMAEELRLSALDLIKYVAGVARNFGDDISSVPGEWFPFEARLAVAATRRVRYSEMDQAHQEDTSYLLRKIMPQLGPVKL